MTANIWISLLPKQKKSGNTKSFSKFRVYALKSKNNTTICLSLLNLDVTPYTNTTIVEYICLTMRQIGDSSIDLRIKSRMIPRPVEHPYELTLVNFDGSSTGQASREDAIVKDPFRDGKSILRIIVRLHAICDSYTLAVHEFGYMFTLGMGLSKENTLLQTNVQWPLGWPVGGYQGPQACVYVGINISSTNGEVTPGQVISYHHLAKYQVGPRMGIEAGDHIWCSRYLLERIIEQVDGDWNGVGCRTNCSMGEEGGFELIKKHISTSYGKENGRRLKGKHETANIDTFSWVVTNCGCSFRVGRDTKRLRKGYLEDRRPALNMNPYVVILLHAETTIL
ncbi:hypothetical protein ACJRO7_010344 [Eucalyptus globulus]|uniref:glutamine synthetase n=1 Tax=Eucalyptus globulus TaxID=34317 RepID=A0ABD3LGH0_EUCGL